MRRSHLCLHTLHIMKSERSPDFMQLSQEIFASVRAAAVSCLISRMTGLASGPNCLTISFLKVELKRLRVEGLTIRGGSTE